MLSKSFLKSFVRTLRTPSKRVAVNTYKGDDDRSAIPLSEIELKKIKEKNEKMNFEVVDPSLSFTNSTSVKKIDENQGILESMKKKQTFVKLEDLKTKNPLLEAPTIENQMEMVADAVTPLSKYPYLKQLKIKQRHCENVLREVRKVLKKVNAPMGNFTDRLPCPMEQIIPSPETMYYRNKDEFSVSKGVDGNPKTVGYFIGLPRDPNMRCISPTNLTNIKSSHKLVAKHFQAFIEESPHSTCFKFKEGGVWRNITARSNLKGEVMAVVNIFPGFISPEEKENIKQSLQHYFFRGPGAECELASLYLQACPFSRCKRDIAPYELIEGKSHLVEECLGNKFHIAPDSFFETNTLGAELLYDSIIRVSEPSSHTTLLDVCCGIGPVSILMAPKCRGAIGIDESPASIEDAKINARENGVRNASYVCNKIETILPAITRDLEDSADVIAVVNPARSGLDASAVECIRQCESIRKLVYVSSKPEGNSKDDMALLCSTLKPNQALKETCKFRRRMKGASTLGRPFSLKYVIPHDLNPQTLHVEYVLLFDRVEQFYL